MKTAWSSGWLLILLVLAWSASARGSLCEIENGESSITVNIMAGREKEVTQITPEELPIIGDPGTEIALDFIFSTGKPVFTLNGKCLRLLKPLTRDKDSFSPFVFQLICTVMNEKKERIIPIIVKVSDDISERPLHERTLSEETDSGKNISQMSQNVSVTPVDFDTFPYGNAVVLPLVVLVLVALSVLFICQLRESWKFRKLKERKERIYRRMGERNDCTRVLNKERGPDYGFAWKEMGILWSDRGSFDSLLVECNHKNNALSNEEASNVTKESTAIGGQRSVNSDPRATAALNNLSISNDSSRVTEMDNSNHSYLECTGLCSGRRFASLPRPSPRHLERCPYCEELRRGQVKSGFGMRGISSNFKSSIPFTSNLRSASVCSIIPTIHENDTKIRMDVGVQVNIPKDTKIQMDSGVQVNIPKNKCDVYSLPVDVAIATLILVFILLTIVLLLLLVGLNNNNILTNY